ncbi:MAG: ribosome hibernation-promoting factor, HPF/YfiA family [Candidatus Aminicenantia bacterium]
MNTNYTGRNVEITPDFKKYTEKRLKKLEKFLGPIIEAEVIFSTEKYRHIVEVNVKAKNSNLNGIEESEDVFISLNSVFDNLDRRAKKIKGKFKERKRKTSKTPFLSLPTTPTRKRIIRSESYSLKPMTVEEAITRIKSNEKEVFVFRNLNSGKLNVIHKKKNGSYELIEPE